jgi:adenylate kinase
MQQPIVFVGGVHGSGKTTLSRLLAGLIPASHVTAGTLIREASSTDHVVTIGAQDKVVPDVDANQAVLLRGLTAYQRRAASDARLLLLDGHFALLGASGAIESVGLDVFRAISPIAVLLVETSAVTVHARLSARAADAPRIELIQRLAERERERALETAHVLGIPMFTAVGERADEDQAQPLVEQLRVFGEGL